MSETVTDLSRRCPRCGRQLPRDAREGLCAACLLTAGAETLTGSSDATSTGGASTADSSRLGAPRLVDGQLWGAYQVLRLLACGGMGEVCEAEQLETGRRLALKVLRGALRGAEDGARFLREGQLAASISHAHTVYIFGSEEVGGAPAITMELLSGGTLKDRLTPIGRRGRRKERLARRRLLAAVSMRAFDSAAEPSAPVSGTMLLHRLASEAPPDLAHAKAELVRLASAPTGPSRVRRALPIVMAAMPAAALFLVVGVMLPVVARSIRGNAGNILRQRSGFVMWMTWITDSGADAELKTREQRTAAEQYVAAHFGSQLTSNEFWNTQLPQIEPFLSMRRTAAAITARYPAISPDELAHASAIVAPQIQELAAQSGNVGAHFPAGGDALRGLLAKAFASIPVLGSIVCGLISVLAVPGGLVACGGEPRRPRDWPGAIGDAVPGRLVSGAHVDRLGRSPDLRRAACVSGRRGCRGQSRVLNDDGRRRVDHSESTARTA